jgi:hypothetical protein
MPPNYYAQQQQPAVVTGRPPLVSIISPEDAKKIRKMQWVNFACTMVRTNAWFCGYGGGFDRFPVLQTVPARKQTGQHQLQQQPVQMRSLLSQLYCDEAVPAEGWQSAPLQSIASKQANRSRSCNSSHASSTMLCCSD